MTAWVDGAAVLAFVGIGAPSPGEQQWADAVAAAVSSGVDVRLNGALIDDPSPAHDELTAAAQLAAGEAFKRRSTPFGVTGYADLQGVALRVARDYLDGVAPLIARYSNGPGIG